MKSYYLRYIVLWAPACLAACFFNNTGTASQVLQWICVALMIVGWTINTAMSAYNFPALALANTLLYFGVNEVLAILFYSTNGGANAKLIQRLTGLFSYTPLDIVVTHILDLDIPHELYIIGFLSICMAGGVVAALYYRRIRPNPYRPSITRRKVFYR